MARIAILGAGLLGRLLALQQTDAHEVHLFERDSLHNTNATGRVAAAMVAPIAESATASPTVVAFGMQSLSLWSALLAPLGLSECFQQKGSLILAHANDKPVFDNFSKRVQTNLLCHLNLLSKTQAHQLEPELPIYFHHILHLPNEAHIDNQLLFDTTAERIQSSQIKLYTSIKAEIDNTENTKIAGIKTTFDWIIDCRGLGAKHKLLNTSQRLRGVRGEVARVYAPEVNLHRPIRLMHPRYPIYVVPKPNNEYVIGATEIESESDKPPTVRSTLELLSAAYSVHSGFAEAEIQAIQSGLRPTLSDNDPAITVQQRCIQANGLYRHGYLLAPVVLQQIDALLNTTSDIKLDKRLVQFL